MLEWAPNDARIVLTHELATMRDYAYQRIAAGLPMPGVFEMGSHFRERRSSKEFS